MNIKHLLKKGASRLFRLIPSWMHCLLLKRYLSEPSLALKHGVNCVRQDYSSPIAVPSEINIDRLGQKRLLPGISFDDDQINDFGVQIARFADEFPWKSVSTNKPEVPWGDMFPTIDSLILYTVIRHITPKRYVEVGCGYSSQVSSRALESNLSEGVRSEARYIEPFPGERLSDAHLCGQLIVNKVQDVSLELFQSLTAGDILFIDTSHVMKCQSDVEWELLHILPSLNRGVIVHIHDIYTPYDQPLGWLQNNYAPGMYNEQYAFEALLSGGNRFSCLFPVHSLCRERPEIFQQLFGVNADSSRSFWISVS